MPSRLDSPVLSLSINNISKIDTSNVDNLFGMWTIFSRCAESLENGRRLENLSWRLWNQETFYTGTESKFRASLSSSESARSRSNTSSTEDVPALSSSVESASSTDKYAESSFQSDQSTLSRRSSRGKERHINPVGLARLMSNMGNNEVEQIIEEHARSPRKQPAKPIDVPAAPKASTEDKKASTESTVSDISNGSHSSVKSTHSVVRGFAPGLVSNSYRSSTKLAPEVSIKEEVQTREPARSKKGGMFIVGSSPSDASDSYDGSRYGSVLSNDLRRVASTSSKRAAFVDEVQTRTIVNDDEDDEDDYITEDESAIEEDDWDSVSEGGSSYTEDNMFARVEEPRPAPLPSRRSLLSTLLHQGDRAAALARAGTRSAPAIRSRTSSPNGPSVPATPVREAPIQHITGARAVPIVTTNLAYPPALSPRTTRRSMLSTELTESLRKHLLWERQQKNKVANAVLRRRHTAHDMQNMTDYPQRDRTGSYTGHFDQGADYHLTGW